MITNEEFLRAVFGEDWKSAHLTSFHEDPTDPNLDRRRWMGGHAAHRLPWAIPTRNNYFTVSQFGLDEKGVARRRKALFKKMPLVVVDDVDEVKVSSRTAFSLLGSPSYRLETSPGNEQLGYLFNLAIEERHAAEALVDEMIKRGLTSDGVDPGMRGVTRYVRLPVGSNNKAKHGPLGFRTKLLEWNPEHRHNPRWMAKELGFDLGTEALLRRRAEEIMTAGLKGERGSDALLAALELLDLVKPIGKRADTVEITCPFLEEHTGNVDTGTAYMRGGGGIACHHGHCRTRQRGDYVKRVCNMLSAMGTPEAEAAIYNLTAHAELRKELRVTAKGLILNFLPPDAVRDRLEKIVRREGVAQEIREVEIEEALRWAYKEVTDKEKASRPGEEFKVVLRYNAETKKLEWM